MTVAESKCLKRSRNLKTSTGAGRIRRRTLTLRPAEVGQTHLVYIAGVLLLTAPECVERERGLWRLLRKAANRGAGNCVPSRPR